MINGVFGQCTVSDLARAEEWYERLFGSPPDTRPMPGLIEWRLGPSYGIQVWSEPDRAESCSVVLFESDLDATATRLTSAGLENNGPEPGGGGRILRLIDPDGNRIVFVGA